MPGKREAAREALLAIGSPEERRAFLLAGSALPGPRANLELLDAAGDVLALNEALRFAALGPSETPDGIALEFLPCCGVVALGRFVAEGDLSLVDRLRVHASDPRWRVRESVAIALQRWGDADVVAMLGAVEPWAAGASSAAAGGESPGASGSAGESPRAPVSAGSAGVSLLEARAAVAAACEPRLLRTAAAIDGCRRILDAATAALVAVARPRGEPGRVLGAALGYGWSVGIAASPSTVLPAFEWWAASPDPDVRRLVRENLTKNRFVRAAPDAVARLKAAIG
jgi:hypothetical protein